ncbi:hypothetical protein L0Y65_06140 [Candidatus Micrarchaeota archaeon]|nr:hypothetical protein [Candidatus Micrarchaeota archaeon]
MAVHSLFDLKRKKEIREGLQNGRLDLKRRKFAGRNAGDEAPTAIFSRSARSPDEAGQVPQFPRSMQPVPAGIQSPPLPAKSPPKGSYAPDGAVQAQLSADAALFKAIRFGDLDAAKDAIGLGANVNALLPGDGYNGNVDSDDTQVFDMLTPLRLARKIGREDMADLLRKHGAAK